MNFECRSGAEVGSLHEAFNLEFKQELECKTYTCFGV